MVTIRITRKFDASCVAELKIADRLNIVLGDSATGKTHICSMLEEREGSAFDIVAINSDGENVPVYYCATLSRFEEITLDKSKDYCVVAVDEYVATELLRDNKKSGLLSTTCKYFLVFHRDATVKFNVGVNSVLKVVYDDHIYRFQKALNFNKEYNLDNLKKCDVMIIEDSKSGFKIMKRYFNISNKMKVENTEGNGRITARILEAYNEGHSIIVGLDYDMGANMLYKMQDLAVRGELDNNNVYLINMESIEEVLCNSELILSKCPTMIEPVRDIEKYIDCSFKHRGEYFLELLKHYFVIQNGNNKRSLYTKTSASCFVHECNECTRTSCKFRNNTEKVTMVFSNKYNILHELYCYLNK